MSLSTLRKESLYLPGFYGGAAGFSTVADNENLPGIKFHVDALQTAFSIGLEGQGVSDYTGESNIAMFRYWQALSRTSATVARIPQLVWTDVAANAVVGSRSLQKKTAQPQPQPQQKKMKKKKRNLWKRDGDADDSDLVPVIVHERRVRYRLVYGIPAFITLACTLVILCLMLLVLLSGNSGTSKMRSLLNKTSQGRILTSRVSPASDSGADEVGLISASTKDWIDSVGKKHVTLTAVREDGESPVDGPRSASQSAPLLKDAATQPKPEPSVRVDG